MHWKIVTLSSQWIHAKHQNESIMTTAQCSVEFYKSPWTDAAETHVIVPHKPHRYGIRDHTDIAVVLTITCI